VLTRTYNAARFVLDIRSEIVSPCICWLFKWRRGEGFPYAPPRCKDVLVVVVEGALHGLTD